MLFISAIMAITMTACSSVNKDDTVATVNGTKMTVEQYEKTLALYKQSIEAMYGNTIWEQEVEKGVKYKDKFKEIILQQMVDTQAVYDVAKKENLLPSKEDVDKSFKELKTNIDADENYKKQLESIGIDDTFLKDQQEKDLAWQNYKANFYKITEVTDKEVQEYYDKNKSEFYKNEVDASHILISTVDENKKELSEDKKKEAKKKAEDVLKKVKDGGDFASLAKEYSDDKLSAEKGGQLGFFGKGDMVEPFEKAAFALDKGKVSDLVESQFGYHIIKVNDKVNEQKTFEEVKDTIKETVLYNKYAENIKGISESAKVEENKNIVKKVKI